LEFIAIGMFNIEKRHENVKIEVTKACENYYKLCHDKTQINLILTNNMKNDFKYTKMST
jgi:DNA/RNA-binding domain of Phe-tRNA-synthetase-like protein